MFEIESEYMTKIANHSDFDHHISTTLGSSLRGLRAIKQEGPLQSCIIFRMVWTVTAFVKHYICHLYFPVILVALHYDVKAFSVV